MKVSGPGKIETSAIRRKGAAPLGAGGSFSTSLTDSATHAGHAQGVSVTAQTYAVSALLGLQEVDDPPAGRKQALTRADSMLDLLDEIRHGILMGTIPKHKLRQLLFLSKSRPEAFIDTTLSGIVGEIELRAKVELAKIEMSEKLG